MKESAMISTIMIRTLMDERYYYGIRQEAAFVLSKVSSMEDVIDQSVQPNRSALPGQSAVRERKGAEYVQKSAGAGQRRSRPV